MRSTIRYPATTVLLLVLAQIARANPPAEELLRVLDSQIAAHPKDARLYLQRGEIYRTTRNWSAAADDYERAHALDPRLDEVDLAYGEMMLGADAPQNAVEHLSRYLTKHPDDGRARLTRARALVRVGNAHEAIGDYDRAIALTPNPQPDHVLERARLLVTQGRPADAVKGIDEVSAKLGPVPTLQLEAVEIEVSSGKYDAAVNRLEALLARTPRQAAWMTRRAEILAQAGRKQDAKLGFDAALEVIRSQPPSRQALPAIRELERRIQHGKEKVS